MEAQVCGVRAGLLGVLCSEQAVLLPCCDTCSSAQHVTTHSFVQYELPFTVSAHIRGCVPSVVCREDSEDSDVDRLRTMPGSEGVSDQSAILRAPQVCVLHLRGAEWGPVGRLRVAHRRAAPTSQEERSGWRSLEQSLSRFFRCVGLLGVTFPPTRTGISRQKLKVRSTIYPILSAVPECDPPNPVCS